MAAKSSYWYNLILNAIRGTNITAPTTLYVSLHTGDPALTGANEVSGNAYARIPVTFAAPSAGAILNNAVVTFVAPSPAGWGTVTYAGLFDALTAGNFLYKIPLNFSVATSIGVPVEFEVNQLSITES